MDTNENEILFLKRMFDLEEKLVQTKECKQIDSNLDEIFDELKQYLPKDKQDLTKVIEDCFTSLLILHEEYFYKNGYLDNFGKYNSLDFMKRRLLSV